MNLLVLGSWFPYPPGNGSRIRAYYLLRELARAGHTIRLVAGLQNDVADEKDAGVAALRDMGIAEIVTVPWHWYDGGGKSGLFGKLRAALSPVPRSILETPNPALSQAIAEQLARSTDAVLVMEMGMDAYLPAQLPKNIPFILEGAEVSSFAAPAPNGAKPTARARKAIRYWQKRLRRYQAYTAVSRHEAELVSQELLVFPDGPKTCHLLPNGVDTTAYGPRDWDAIKPAQLIYNGSVNYGPNQKAVFWFARDVLPKVREKVPEVIFKVTGKFDAEDAKLWRWTRGKVDFTGFVPDLKPLLSHSAVCVVPLLYGGGTRLKILEAWGAGVPVVSTTVGAAGLEGAIPGIHLLQVEITTFTERHSETISETTAKDFAQATVRLLSDPALCRTLSENARTLVVERYDWAIIGEQLNRLLSETCRACKPS